jgi:hypothetical protein
VLAWWSSSAMSAKKRLVMSLLQREGLTGGGKGPIGGGV